jgi:hypothetical protein
MANLFETGAAFLADQLKEHGSQTVTYTRGADSVEVQAVVGRKDVLVETSAGALERHEQWDFLVAGTDLVLADNVTLPERGDRIKLPRANHTDLFEVMPLAGEDHWRWSDGFERLLRIHTKFVGTE